MNLSKYVVNVKNFPVKGVEFKDLTLMLKHHEAFAEVVKRIVEFSKKQKATTIVAPEARGFWFAPSAALQLKIPFIPIRKKGKLPRETISVKYELEYGTDILEIHKKALNENDKVIIFDDILATGGTIKSCKDLVEKTGAEVVGLIFIGEIKFLKGAEKIKDVHYETMLDF